MFISEEFIKHTSQAVEHHKDEHLTCTFEERDAALIRLYKNIHSKDEIKTLLGRKYKANIVDLFILCKSLKYMFFKTETVLPLATTGIFAETFGNQRKVSRVIDNACKIGLLEEVNGKYSYNSATTVSLHFKPNAKEYVCNREVIKVIEEIKEEENIEVNNIENSNIKEYERVYNNTVVDTFAQTDYSIVSKTLVDDTDDNILAGLYNHYPYMKDFQALADELNEKAILNEMERIKFRFNIHRGDSGKVTKIGCRATNRIVSYKEHENNNPNYKGVWRKDYMKATFDEYEEYDVHSSISNVNYLLNHGTWLGMDCYKQEYGREWTENASRTWYKGIFMKLYFNTSNAAAAKSIVADVNYRKTQDCLGTIGSLKDNITNFLGKTYGSEIFFHESCIYLLVRKELMNRGIKCSQVYDGFYFKKGEMPEDMDRIVKECAELYYNKYFIGEKQMDITSEAFNEFVEITKKAMEAQEKAAAERAAKRGYRPRKADKRCVWFNVEDIPGEWCEECIYNKCEYCPDYKSPNE